MHHVSTVHENMAWSPARQAEENGNLEKGNGKRVKKQKWRHSLPVASISVRWNTKDAMVSVWLFRPGQPIITLATKEKEPMEIENEKGKKVNRPIARREGKVEFERSQAVR